MPSLMGGGALGALRPWVRGARGWQRRSRGRGGAVGDWVGAYRRPLIFGFAVLVLDRRRERAVVSAVYRGFARGSPERRSVS